MKEDSLDQLFQDLKGHFDAHEPPMGHQERFLERLKGQNKRHSTPIRTLWAPLSIAATVLVLLGLAFGLFAQTPSVTEQVAEISPEIGQTQYYFASLVEGQLKELEASRTPKTEKIIADALVQIKSLESNFSHLERELINGGNSKLLLSAMITNFQTRIDLLQEVMQQIENITITKDDTDEKHTL